MKNGTKTIERLQGGLRQLLFLLFLANTSMIAVYESVRLIFLPIRVSELAKTGKVEVLAFVTALAAIAAVLALPLGGALSDRIGYRFRRRTPWIIAMSCASACFVSVLNLSTSICVLVLLSVGLCTTIGIYQGALGAIIPDRIPIAWRARASGVISLSVPLGVLVGVNVAGRMDLRLGATLISGLLVLTSVFLALGICGSRPSPRNEAFSDNGAGSKIFIEAFRSRDFLLTFASRALLFLAFYSVNGYLYYTVQDYIGASEIPNGDVPAAVSTLGTVFVGGWIAIGAPAGWLMIGQTHLLKAVLALSAVGMALSTVVPVISPTWHGMLLYVLLSGAFSGVFFAGDISLMSMVLPRMETYGRDFAILTVASGMSQIISSPLAAAVIRWGGGYIVLYLCSAVCACLSACLVLQIKKNG